MLIYIFEQ